VEEGELPQWRVEVLSPHVAEVVVVRGERRVGAKNDRLDAYGLAERLRTGQLGRAVFKDAGTQFRALREAVRVYQMVTQDLVRTKNRVKGAYRRRGIVPRGEAVYDPRRRGEWARRLAVPARASLGLL
jgi:hypothetical protein